MLHTALTCKHKQGPATDEGELVDSRTHAWFTRYGQYVLLGLKFMQEKLLNFRELEI